MSFLFYYVVNQSIVYQQIELCGLFSVLADNFLIQHRLMVDVQSPVSCLNLNAFPSYVW